MQTLRSLVIGTGVISEEHLRFIQADPDAVLLAVCDLSPALARFAAERFSASRWGTDYKKLIAELSPDVVHVLTPPHTHEQIVRDVLEAGSHVVVEKPVAFSLERYAQLGKIAESKRLYLVEDHNYRFNAPIRELDGLIAQGILGQVNEVDVRMHLAIREGGRYADMNLPHPSHRAPAGVIHEFLTHLSYLALHFVPEFEHVATTFRNVGGGDLFKYDDLDARYYGASSLGRIRFSCHGSPSCFSIHVVGDEGSAAADLFQPHVTIQQKRGGPAPLTPILNMRSNGRTLVRAARRVFLDKILQKTAYEGLEHFLRLTYRAIRDGTEPPVTSDDIRRTLALMDAILAKENQT